MSKKTLISLSISLGLPQLAGGIGAIATRRSIPEWYETLEKPSWRPPRWVFGPVWTILYALMGLASWMVWRSRPKRRGVDLALAIYSIHLAANTMWSVIFFGFRRPGAALVEIVLLYRLVVEVTVRFWRIRPLAGMMLLPYLAWIKFAAALNAAIWWKNR